MLSTTLLCFPRTPPPHSRTPPSPRLDIAVCNGGSCAENGGETLLSACKILSAGDTDLEVTTVYCSGECPAKFAMLSPRKGALEAVATSCSTLEDAVASAETAIAAAGSTVAPGLKEAFLNFNRARAAEEEGDLAAARDAYAAAIASAPSGLLVPCQQPLEPEPIEWAGSKWAERLFSSELVLVSDTDRAAAAADDGGGESWGTCGGTNTVVDRKVVTTPRVTLRGCVADGTSLAGKWTDEAGGTGEFHLRMCDRGRTFSGTLSRDGESGPPATWRGVRRSAPARGRGGRGGGRGGRGRGMMRNQPPPSSVEWIHQSRLGMSRCSLGLGDAAVAVDEARAATELCCRTASGWTALAEALEASGDDVEGAQRARAEVEYLTLR